MVSKLRSLHFPLHIHITTLFITLTVILSLVLNFYSYRQSSEILLEASDLLSDQLGHQIELEFQRSYEPISQAANLIAHASITQATNLDQRLEQLPMLVTALQDRPEMAALGVSYDSGDFFIVRVINDTHMRLTFNAPDNAWYQIDNITTAADGSRRIERVYYDRQLHQLRRFDAGPTQYDPRVRPWYQAALQAPTAAVTDPYLYFFIRKVGITFSRRSANNNAVIAADIALDMLADSVRSLPLVSGAQLVLLDSKNQVLAYNRNAALIQEASDSQVRMVQLNELPSPALQQLGDISQLPAGRLELELAGEDWHGSLRTLSPAPGIQFQMLILMPRPQLLSSARDARNQGVLITLLISLLALPVIWFMAHRIAMPLRRLASQAAQIQQFKLDSPIQSRSIVREVDELALTMSLMQRTLAQFIRLIRQISAEEDFSRLLPLITNETMHSTTSKGVILYLVDDSETWLQPEQYSFPAGTVTQLDRLPIVPGCQLSHSLQTGELDRRSLKNCGTPALTTLSEHFDEPLLCITIPLRTRRNAPLGILCLLSPHDERTDDHLAMIRTMADFSSMTLESRQHETHQKALMKAFIELIANAIDAKSPYTAGHCQRVPELTRLLVQAACDSQHPPFKNYQLNAQQWEALHIASWLHDCGKVVTPEYVVDKATKLETLYDRIHEVRMRFEVLKREVDIRYWQGIAQGQDSTQLAAERDQQKAELDNDFAFVASCNIGGEFMAPDKQQRLQKIAERQWQRTLDDRLGVGIEEQQRKALQPSPTLPVMEPLLADKQDHLIPFSGNQQQHGRFNLTPGQHQFNRGELYNLGVQRGTLTAEERHIINDHIVQTILMLEQLPYPKHLRDIPQLAGQHHEKMDGTGYPCGLKGHEMPLSSRAMAIADIFEALTAADRPYKAPKSVSEALRIMSFMRNDKHIDGELFDLFLTSGIWRNYGERFLLPEQLDDVDISPYLQHAAPEKNASGKAVCKKTGLEKTAHEKTTFDKTATEKER
ncbi:MAG: hypothetical protein OIF57_18085 [Marinobacterium sp.]|nr:hypothetical protein [Marinobacterium sp.]